MVEVHRSCSWPRVILETMSEMEWAAWRTNSVRNFAREMVRVGSWPEDGAETRAAAEHARLVPENERGSGYGRAAMMALEPIVKALGYDAIRLHVFGDNVVARHLYRAVGYDETGVSMTKRLGQPADRLD